MESAEAEYNPVIMSVPAGPGGADAHADVSRRGAGEALGHMAGGFDMPRKDVLDPAVRAHRRVERVDRRSGQAESLGGALDFENSDGRVDRPHPCHFACSLSLPDSRSTPSSRAEWSSPPSPLARSGASPACTYQRAERRGHPYCFLVQRR